MRSPVVVACSLSAIALAQQTSQAATPVPQAKELNNVPVQDRVVSTITVAPTQSLSSTVAIAQPERLAPIESAAALQNTTPASIAPRETTPLPPRITPIAEPKTVAVRVGSGSDRNPGTNSQVQGVVVQTEETPTVRAPIAPAPKPLPTLQPVAPVANLPAPTIAAKPIAAKPVAAPVKPVVVKPAPVAAAPKPVIAPKPVVTPKPPALPTTIAPDLAVDILDVKITGVDPEIVAILRNQIKTQPGQQSSINQIQKDITALLETGLISNANFTTQITRDGINVQFQAAPVIVKDVRLVNAKVITPEVVNNIFKPQIGQAVQPSRLTQGIKAVEKWYADNGFITSRVLGLEPSRSGSLSLTVQEGKIDDIQIRFVDEFGRTVDDKGNVIKGKTKTSLIQQEIKSKVGDIFQAANLQKDLQNLLKTGLFKDAGITIEGDENKSIVVYNLIEGANKQANLGGGFSNDSGLYGSATYNDRNFLGLGKQLGGNITIGTKDIQFDGKFSNPYRESDPNRWGYSVNAFRQRGGSRVFDDDILLANGDSVREGRIGAGVTFNRGFGKGWDGSVGLNYARISQSDGSGSIVSTDVLGNPLSVSGTGVDNAVNLGFGLSRDRRDNPNDPKSGSLLLLTSEQGIPIAKGSTGANKLTANYSQYLPISLFNKNKDDRSKQEVLAFNVQGGTTIGQLAPYNAFTLGGLNSVRGYGQGEVGTSRSFIQASAEYRFPILSAVGGTLFADYATDLGSSASVPGQPGIDRGRPGSGLGVGAGVRVKSPIGTLRADWAFTSRGDNRIQFGIGEKF
jgi:outer membrane protein insertion porin family